MELSDAAGDLGVLDVPRNRGLVETPAASTHVVVRDGDLAAGQDADTVPQLTVESPAAAVVLAHLRQQVIQVQTQDQPVRLDAPDSVHKMRVATRRLRSALTTFESLFDARVTRPPRNDLKWLAAELGAARDAEVMRDRVSTAIERESHRLAVRVAADDALLSLAETYRAAHDQVLRDLDGNRYQQLLTTLQALVEQPPLRKRAQAPAAEVLPPLVARSYDKVAALVEGAGSLPAGAARDEMLHDARKTAKQTRYAAEAVAPAFGRDAALFAVAMENLQEALGEHQDSVLTRERLLTLAVTASSTEVAFLYGRLHALEEARAELSQHDIEAVWKAAGRRSLHRWLHQTGRPARPQ